MKVGRAVERRRGKRWQAREGESEREIKRDR
jgi:hypothetical protein